MYLLITQQSINFNITLFVQDITVILTKKTQTLRVFIKYVGTDVSFN